MKTNYDGKKTRNLKLNSQTFAKQQKEIRLNESKQFNKLVQIDIEWRAERERGRDEESAKWR